MPFLCAVLPFRSRLNGLRRLCLAMAFALLPPLAGAHAQPAEGPAVNFWLQGGPAVTTLGTGVHAGFGMELDRHVFSVRGTSTDRNLSAGTWDMAFLYGRALERSAVHLSAGAGVAVVGGERYRQFFGRGAGESFDPMIGFPLEGRVSWKPISVLALGLYGFANVNTEQPFGGVGANVRVGWLR